MYDPVTRRYRSRELFAETLDFDSILAPDPRIVRARALAAEVTIREMAASPVRRNEVRIVAMVPGDKAAHDVLVAIDTDARLRFAQCDCDFFKTNIMNLGPCEHILAARFAAENQLSQTEIERILKERSESS